MKLEEKDKVAIVAPASQLRGDERHFVERAADVLVSWGLRPEILVESTHHFYLAGRDEPRAGHLQRALSDPETKAIFCTRGGYGSPRLLRLLVAPDTRCEKFLVGYSDITALHMCMARLCPDLVRIHGPNVATKQFLDDGADAHFNRNSLRALLFGEAVPPHQTLKFIKAGVSTGRLEGGCLSMIVNTIGTRFAPSTAGSILFLEDVGEPPYKVDRMLTHLSNAGLFDRVAGVVLGAMHKCEDPYNPLEEVVADVFRTFSFPVAMGLQSGHGPRNQCLRLGDTACLDSRDSCITFPD